MTIFFPFFCLKFCINVKNKYEKGIFYHFVKGKNHQFFKKLKIKLQHFVLVLVW
jgi:hypothetical protein